MSIFNRVYCVQLKYFFISGGTEYACAVDSRNLSLWYFYEQALDELNHARRLLEQEGYLIKASELSQDETSHTVYRVRLERSDGRAAVFEVYRKEIHGLPTGHQLIF